MKLESEIINRNQFRLKLEVRRDLRESREHFHLRKLFISSLTLLCVYLIITLCLFTTQSRTR
jgi:hypothetical protein